MIPPSLLRYLILNRQQTRAGRATWLYLSLWAAFLVLDQVFVHELHVATTEGMDPFFLGFALASPLLLLLNRLDTSGPTQAQAEEAARASSERREAERIAGRRQTLSWKAGALVGRLLRRSRR